MAKILAPAIEVNEVPAQSTEIEVGKPDRAKALGLRQLALLLVTMKG
jgi:hypothetical protein